MSGQEGAEPLTGQPSNRAYTGVEEPFIDLWVIQPCATCRWLPSGHAGPCLPVNGESG